MSSSGNAPLPGWLRCYRPAWCAVAALLALPGITGAWLVLGAGSAVVLLAGLTVLAALAVWQFGAQHGYGRPGTRAVLLGAGYSLGLVAVLGLGYLVGAVGVVLGALVAAAGWPLRRRATPAVPPAPPPAPPAPPPGPALETIPVVPFPAPAKLRRLGTAELCWTWRATYVYLRRYRLPNHLEYLADLRRACLDELERRDPVAFGRWIATARAAGDPARYFGEQWQR